MQKMLYTVPEACKMLSVGMTRMYELINAGDLPAVKIGRKTLIRSEAIKEFTDNLPSFKQENQGV